MNNNNSGMDSSKKLNTHTMKKADVQKSPDAKTDQDYPGFPGGQSALKIITPVTKAEKTIAAYDVKDGDKMTDDEKANAQMRVAGTTGEI